MSPQIVFSCVLSILGGWPPSSSCQTDLVLEVVHAVHEAEVAHHVPAAVIAAVIFHESHFDAHAVSADGMDLGLMQIRRGGAIPTRLAHLSDSALQNIRLNVSIGAAYLARMIHICPRYFLDAYNGGGCRATSYGVAVAAGFTSVRSPP